MLTKVDTLTGLPNRRQFDECRSVELGASADREAICRMAGIDSDDVLEQRGQDMVSMHDTQMWSVGAFRHFVASCQRSTCCFRSKER